MRRAESVSRGEDVDESRFQVRVQPKAGRNDVRVVDGGLLRVTVTAPPERGKANEALVALLAKRLSVAKGDVRILRGHRARDKVIQVHGLSTEEVLKRLSAK